MTLPVRKHLRVLLPLALLVSLAACGGSSSPTAGSGTVYVGGTDAPGDFLDYTVTFQSLTLTREDGTVVNLLPSSATVNLAQDDALTDLLTAAVVPAGTYTSAVATIDYGEASIEAIGPNGTPVALSPVNAQGQALGTVSVPIEFGNDAALVVRPGEPQFLTLDFALAASNTVNLTTSPPTVVVSPFLDASIGFSDNTVRLRGPLESVAASAGTYTVGIRPFFAGTVGGGVTIATTSSTVYDVNGVTYQGSAGLAALAALPTLTATSSRVTYNPSTGTLTASAVYAGSSVPGGTLDALRGTVTAVSGSLLTVRGAVLVRSQGTVVYGSQVTVTTGPQTVVHEDGTMGTQPLDAVSVGQRITALGTLSGTGPDSFTLDVSPGEIRMGVTQLRGTVEATASGSLTMDLLSIDRRPVSLFDFAGTGSSSALDANPSSYVVATGALPLAGLSVGDPIRVSGFVTPYGSAPPDFDAVSVADYANGRAFLIVSWLPNGTSAAFAALNDGGIVPNLSSNPGVDLLVRGDVAVDLTALSTAPTVEPATTGFYLIRQDGTVTVHTRFAGFVSDLDMRLGAGAEVKAFWAEGGFNSVSDDLTANLVTVRLS
jgi:hypothetical protein